MTAWPESIALVGAGKMGGAMLRGWLAGGLRPEGVAILDPAPAPEMIELARSRGLALPPPPGFKPEVVVLAVKPQTLDAAAPSIAELAHADALVVSIIAGKRIADLQARAPKARAFVRAMPNTPAAVGRGMSVCCAGPGVSAAQRGQCAALLEAVGDVAWVEDEALLDPVTAVSGGGPAYVFLLVECLAEAGVAAGLPPALAMQIARATVAGSGELLRQSPEPAAVLRQNVTSPAGTTLEALKILMAENGLQSLLTKAIAAATRRSRELAG